MVDLEKTEFGDETTPLMQKLKELKFEFVLLESELNKFVLAKKNCGPHNVELIISDDNLTISLAHYKVTSIAQQSEYSAWSLGIRLLEITMSDLKEFIAESI